MCSIIFIFGVKNSEVQAMLSRRRGWYEVVDRERLGSIVIRRDRKRKRQEGVLEMASWNKCAMGVCIFDLSSRLVA
jgi:hypothetical protein